MAHNCKPSITEAENQRSRSAWDVYQDSVSKKWGAGGRMKKKGQKGKGGGQGKAETSLPRFPSCSSLSLDVWIATDFVLVKLH